MATGGRKTQLQVVHQISVALTFASPAGGLVGVLPAGAVLNQIHTQTSVGFNSTTNTVAVGTAPGGAQILAATTIAAAARSDAPVAFGVAGPLATDTPIYFTLASTGAAPTAGAAAVWLDYVAALG
jgi:hypothetical protein